MDPQKYLKGSRKFLFTSFATPTYLYNIPRNLPRSVDTRDPNSSQYINQFFSFCLIIPPILSTSNKQQLLITHYHIYFSIHNHCAFSIETVYEFLLTLLKCYLIFLSYILDEVHPSYFVLSDCNRCQVAESESSQLRWCLSQSRWGGLRRHDCQFVQWLSRHAGVERRQE